MYSVACPVTLREASSTLAATSEATPSSASASDPALVVGVAKL
jgi:hypothetical protein